MSFILGVVIGCLIAEPIFINFIYLSNVALFNDIILTKKNRKKLKEFYSKYNEE